MCTTSNSKLPHSRLPCDTRPRQLNRPRLPSRPTRLRNITISDSPSPRRTRPSRKRMLLLYITRRLPHLSRLLISEVRTIRYTNARLISCTTRLCPRRRLRLKISRQLNATPSCHRRRRRRSITLQLLRSHRPTHTHHNVDRRHRLLNYQHIRCRQRRISRLRRRIYQRPKLHHRRV